MVSIDRLKFYFGLMAISFGKFRAYQQVNKTNKFSLEELINYQNTQLHKTIEYSYNNIPYYKKLFDSLSITPSDIKIAQDLNKLPILRKKDIIKNIDDFYPITNDVRYTNAATGGSTGEPLKYRLSAMSGYMSFALLLRGWGLGGYKIGDKVAIIAGGSLVGKKTKLKKKIVDYILNIRRYSSYGMDENLLKEYVENMKKFQPKYIRGYASSIYLLAKYIHDKKLGANFHIDGIFTTSEMLFSNQREFISMVFNTEVFDTYGLNDGAIAAFECEVHNGMHIDMERGLLEVVDENNQQIYETEGRILATTLVDYAMPLIRYETGDLGIVSKEKCTCQCIRPLLKELKGRITDVLKLNGKYIGSPVITVLMGTTSALQYQFIQTGNNTLLVKLIKDETNKKDMQIIKKSIISQVGEIIIDFEFVDSFQIKDGKKHKFILNEYIEIQNNV